MTDNRLDASWQVPRYDVQTLREKRSTYCICIPVVNEGEKIRKQLERMRPFSNQVDIIIADNGSTDGSVDVDFLKAQNVRALLTLKESGRQGTQLRMAFAYALQEGYEGILQIDGNNKDGVEAIPDFIRGLQEGYDYVQASRFIKGGKAINTPLARWIGVRFLASPILSLGAGRWYSDVTNGFRAYSRRYLLHPGLQLFRDIFVKYELTFYLTVRASQLGMKCTEIPVMRAYPPGKTPTKISRFRGNWDFFATLAKVAMGFYHPPHASV
jgi:glycosyltransferase involved in cell wall biosynthesis